VRKHSTTRLNETASAFLDHDHSARDGLLGRIENGQAQSIHI
jgi:hypothetical protein